MIFEKKTDIRQVVPNCCAGPQFQNFTLKYCFLTWHNPSENFYCYIKNIFFYKLFEACALKDVSLIFFKANNEENKQIVFHWPAQKQFCHFGGLKKCFKNVFLIRAGNSLIGFLSKSLFFRPKMSDLSNLQKKMSDSLIGSFLVSALSDLLTITHFLWAIWANCSWSLIFGKRPEQFAHIAHFFWAPWAICSHRSEELSDSERIAHIAYQKRGNEQKWAIRSFFNKIFFK